MKPEARLFIDCEFDGWGGRLISMALYEGLGRPQFYEAVHGPYPRDPWVANNVIPVLDIRPLYYADFQSELNAFLEQYSAVHVVSDFPDDLKYFCEALITGPGLALQPCEMTFEIDWRRNSRASRTPHNALADAKAIAES